MLRTEVTVGGCCWAVETTIRRSLFYEINAKSYASVAREVIRKFLLAARCSNCSTNYASDIPAASRFVLHAACWRRLLRRTVGQHLTGVPTADSPLNQPSVCWTMRCAERRRDYKLIGY